MDIKDCFWLQNKKRCALYPMRIWTKIKKNRIIIMLMIILLLMQKSDTDDKALHKSLKSSLFVALLVVLP